MSDDKKKFKLGRTGESKGERIFALGRDFAKMAQRPLKKQNSSDAWNERQRRLSSGIDGAKMLMAGTIEKNKEKQGK